MEPIKTDNGYVIRDGDQVAAEITYQTSGNVFIVDHTYVSPELRGQKVAETLLNLVVQEARETGKKIIPVCSYAAAQFKRKKEYEDVWQQ